jgi:hypothetical protein
MNTETLNYSREMEACRDLNVAKVQTLVRSNGANNAHIDAAVLDKAVDGMLAYTHWQRTLYVDTLVSPELRAESESWLEKNWYGIGRPVSPMTYYLAIAAGIEPGTGEVKEITSVVDANEFGVRRYRGLYGMGAVNITPNVRGKFSVIASVDFQHMQTEFELYEQAVVWLEQQLGRVN